MPARRLLSVALGTLLTACSSTPLIDAPPTPAPLPEPTAALVLGDFDPESDFEVFDPCTEIPAAVLAEAGLGELVRRPSYDGDRSVRCSFFAVSAEMRGYFTLTGDRVPFERIAERNLLVEDSTQSAVVGVYLHHMGAEVPDECSAAVHTKRGRFVVQYTETLTARPREELCEVAIDKLEVIFDHLGEDNGLVHRS